MKQKNEDRSKRRVSNWDPMWNGKLFLFFMIFDVRITLERRKSTKYPVFHAEFETRKMRKKRANKRQGKERILE